MPSTELCDAEKAYANERSDSSWYNAAHDPAMEVPRYADLSSKPDRQGVLAFQYAWENADITEHNYAQNCGTRMQEWPQSRT